MSTSDRQERFTHTIALDLTHTCMHPHMHMYMHTRAHTHTHTGKVCSGAGPEGPVLSARRRVHDPAPRDHPIPGRAVGRCGTQPSSIPLRPLPLPTLFFTSAFDTSPISLLFPSPPSLPPSLSLPDESEEVEQGTQSLLSTIESITGESIQQYFQ